MVYWVYFASTSKAGAEDTFELAREHKVISRPAHTEDGSSLIPNVSALSPRDFLLLVYRGRIPHRARLVARIAPPKNKMPGLKAIEKVTGDLAVEMDHQGYPLLPDGTQEVIRL